MTAGTAIPGSAYGAASDDPTMADELQALADQLAALPAIDRLTAGPHGTVAVHRPGRRITGLRLVGDHLEIHVVLAAGYSVAEAAAQVAAATARLIPANLVDLHVDDLAVVGFEVIR
jgi:predicted metal-dependent phosphotriesterase family hydrolase